MMDAMSRLVSSRTPAASDTYTPTRSSSSAALPEFGLNRGHLLRLHESRPSPLLYSRSHTTSPLNSPYVLSPRVPASLRTIRFKNLFSTSESPSRDERASEDGFKSWVDGLRSKAKRALHENEKSEIEFNGWMESEERRQRTLFELPASILAADDEDTVQSVAFETLGQVLIQEKKKRERDTAEEYAAKKARRMQDEDDVTPSMKPVQKVSVPLSEDGIRRSPMTIYEDSQSRSGSEYNGYGGSLQSEDEYGEVYADENVDPHRVADIVADADGVIEPNENDAESAAEDSESLATAQDIQAKELSEPETPSEYDYEEDRNEPADSSLQGEQGQNSHGLDLFSTSLPIDPALFSTAENIIPAAHKTDGEGAPNDKKVEHFDDEDEQEAETSPENELANDGVDKEIAQDDEQEEYDDEYDEYDEYDYDEEYEQGQESGFLFQLDGTSKPLLEVAENHPYSSPPASDLAEEEYVSGNESETSANEPRTKTAQSDIIELSSDEYGENQESGSSPSLSSESEPDEDSYDFEPDEFDEETKGSKWTPSIPFTKPTRVLNDVTPRNRPSVMGTVGTHAYGHDDGQSSDDGEYDEEVAQYGQDEDQYSDNLEYNGEDIQNSNASDIESSQQDDEMSTAVSEQSFQQTFQDDDDPEEERVIAQEERRKELATEEADQEMADVEDNSQGDTEVDTKTKTTPTISEITEESEPVPDDDEAFIEEEAQTPLVHESDSDPNERFPEEDDYWEGTDDIPGPESGVEQPPEFEEAPNEYSIETRKHSTFSLRSDDKGVVTEKDLDDVSLQANVQESK
ncbi:hypothetical protein V1525DRAFT_398878 [Lipomyces kononenkoae]|uniref:Uncharacterized protein n=1 Tax=Lipomyces kononenkoae TaxID=34357 RepID=A0ACC3T5L8_LIPKO